MVYVNVTVWKSVAIFTLFTVSLYKSDKCSIFLTAKSKGCSDEKKISPGRKPLGFTAWLKKFSALSWEPIPDKCLKDVFFEHYLNFCIIKYKHICFSYKILLIFFCSIMYFSYNLSSCHIYLHPQKIGKHFASLRIAAGCLFCRSNWTSKTIAYDIIPILDVILQMCTVSRGLSYRYNCNCIAMTRPQVPLSCSVHSPALSIYNNNMRNFYFCQYVIFTTKPPANPTDGSVKQRKDEYVVKA